MVVEVLDDFKVVLFVVEKIDYMYKVQITEGISKCTRYEIKIGIGGKEFLLCYKNHDDMIRRYDELKSRLKEVSK